MLLHLTHHGLIRISGEEAKPFLQGQLTCNLAEINPKTSSLGAYCDHKGRMLADFFLYYNNPDYYLILNTLLLNKIITQLKKYAAFSQVIIENYTDIFAFLGYLGNQNFLDTIPQESIIISLPGSQKRYEIIIKKQNFENLNLQFDLDNEAANNQWQLENILAGIPTIYSETSEMFTPHMVNFHLINGISFNKGCFVGQEIIARTQHLSKLKRHTYRMQVTSDTPPKPGNPVFSKQQEVGTIVDASPDLDSPLTYQLLVMVHEKDFIEQGINLSPNNNPKEKLIKQNLPYSW